ncbi:DUF1007 family protein [Sulfitobacter noctilucicola]|uniref:ABC-type uncharacterized transport system substrate-binding protein n=1 Tax=Sulfitobacter noctilucicola TaxID=1342301 RepID=A0A7W6M4S7_9RHOB|nr:DUF1007 family protein [Sulfitobacter noctilucicola]MBB4172424.1 ABC-type uncharacterized transport system substrate-binding protein [Sulfitobacter noctilucicola]
MKRLAIALFLLAIAQPLAAHPHIFVDTGLDLRFDQEGRLTEVKITWAYDEFYSLLIMEDRELDPDFDGILTSEEKANLTGFDMQWTPGFNGDLVVMQGDRMLALSGPQEATAIYEDARITTTHVRQIDPEQVVGERIEIRPYDPTYYTAYDITLPVRIEGADICGQRIEVPDLDANMMMVREQLNALDADASIDELNMPDIGILLASTVVVTCDIS